jgi:hypothetical protein
VMVIASSFASVAILAPDAGVGQTYVLSPLCAPFEGSPNLEGVAGAL